VIRCDLTLECASAVQAVSESLGKNVGPRRPHQKQRFHDALQLACALPPRICLPVD